MIVLGKSADKKHEKIRLRLDGGLQNNWEEIVERFNIGDWSTGDNLFTQLNNIEIDIWLDVETGNITVDGAW